MFNLLNRRFENREELKQAAQVIAHCGGYAVTTKSSSVRHLCLQCRCGGTSRDNQGQLIGAYTSWLLHFGTTLTNRVEGAHAAIKDNLTSSGIISDRYIHFQTEGRLEDAGDDQGRLAMIVRIEAVMGHERSWKDLQPPSKIKPKGRSRGRGRLPTANELLDKQIRE
ncbi:hypothetical protein VTP01DRAFT_5182 [Rhizomucor pusillus]|uniref:uncharacterized protein n=1 Tax=Rhizomucor pusillus TaxID=4840 RepID=UPI0037426529